MKKVYLSIISLFAMIITLSGISELTSKAVSPWYVGDVNEDGAVDGTDASLILRAFGELGAGRTSNLPIEAADVNHDGGIDGTDASIVLRMYGEASAQRKVEYEEIKISPVLTKTDKNGFEPNDLVKFTGGSWFLHTDASLSDNNLYPEKNYIKTNNVIAIVEQLADSWYSCFVDCTLNKVFIRVGQQGQEYFTKVGTYTMEDINNIMTSTTSTTTQLTTTSTTSTTTSTTTTTTTTTSTSTTTSLTTSSLTTTTVMRDNTYKKWECIEFEGISWCVRSTAEFTNNVLTYLNNKDIFFIKDYVGNGWYEICFSNSKNESKFYVQISSENEKYFNKLNAKTYMFVGEAWNVRSKKDLSDDTDIMCVLNNGDVIAATTIYDDGWAKIRTNKSAIKELYVVLNPFVALNNK